MLVMKSVSNVSPALIALLASEQARRCEALAGERRMRILLALDGLLPGIARRGLNRTNFLLADAVVWLRGAAHEYERLRGASPGPLDRDRERAEASLLRAQRRLAGLRFLATTFSQHQRNKRPAEAELERYLIALDKTLASAHHALGQLRDALSR